MRDALFLIVPLLTTVIIERFLTRFRTDGASWREPWGKAFDPNSYTPKGRRLLALLYASSLLSAVAVAVVALT
jgi:hypothetical protein